MRSIMVRFLLGKATGQPSIDRRTSSRCQVQTGKRHGSSGLMFLLWAAAFVFGSLADNASRNGRALQLRILDYRCAAVCDRLQ
jgi:hypothetical protein